MKDWIFDKTYIPVATAAGKWRVDMTVYYKDELLVILEIIFRVIRCGTLWGDGCEEGP